MNQLSIQYFFYLPCSHANIMNYLFLFLGLCVGFRYFVTLYCLLAFYNSHLVEMNFKQVMDCLRELQAKHEAIDHKFCNKNSKYTYKTCLEQEDADDLRVFGYTQADTIAKFKAKFKMGVRTRQFTENDANISQEASMKIIKICPERRVQTATIKNGRRRTNMLMMSYEKEKCHSYDNKTLDETHSVQFNCLKQQITRNRQVIQRKSVKKFKTEFQSTFLDDLKAARYLISGSKIKNNKNRKVVYFQNKKSCEDFTQTQTINLTEVPSDQGKSKFTLKTHTNIALCSPDRQLKILQILNTNILEPFYQGYVFAANVKTKGWEEYVIRLRAAKDADKLKYVFVITSSMQVVEVPYLMLHVVAGWLNNTLRDEKLLHLHLVKEKSEKEWEILFEEFLVGSSVSIEYLEWPKLMFRYYLRRFLLLANINCNVKSVMQEEKAFFENFHRVPEGFHKFILELSQKPYSMITSRLTRSQGYLNQILEKGYNEVEMRRLNWNSQKKMMGLQKKSRKQLNFFICFFLSNAYHPSSSLLTSSYFICANQ